MPPLSQQPAPSTQRRLGVTEIALVLVLVIGGAIIWRQQQQITELRSRSVVPSAPSPATGTSVVPTPAAPMVWEIVDYSTSQNCDAGIREQLVLRSGEAAEVIIPSLQEAAQASVPPLFEIAQQSVDMVTLRSVPCGVGLSVEGGEPQYDYWTVRNSDRVLRPMEP